MTKDEKDLNNFGDYLRVILQRDIDSYKDYCNKFFIENEEGLRAIEILKSFFLKERTLPSSNSFKKVNLKNKFYLNLYFGDYLFFSNLNKSIPNEDIKKYFLYNCKTRKFLYLGQKNNNICYFRLDKDNYIKDMNFDMACQFIDFSNIKDPIGYNLNSVNSFFNFLEEKGLEKAVFDFFQ